MTQPRSGWYRRAPDAGTAVFWNGWAWLPGERPAALGTPLFGTSDVAITPRDPGIARLFADTGRWESICKTLGLLGSLLATIGIVVGIVMATHRRIVDCPDGYLSSGSDPNCYSHYQADAGAAVALTSAVPLIVVVLVALGVSAMPSLRLSIVGTSEPSGTPERTGARRQRAGCRPAPATTARVIRSWTVVRASSPSIAAATP